MSYHFATTIKSVRASVRGQYDYYVVADAFFLNSDKSQTNITIEAFIPLSPVDSRKDDIIELEGNIVGDTDDILK
ncbi:971_t:CDS:1, partial [Paraglomus brasilianum]